MTETLVQWRLVDDNPYQPRIVDDPEHIEKLARSIAADGLLQLPKARANGNGRLQLAFGHSRRKAFEWLDDNYKAQGLPDRYEGYERMPVDVADLTDEEMYRHAISENVQRKDLNPIELAKAMIAYRDQFNKSSEEVGQLFGMNGATVRGLVRLLDLPAPVQEKVASGEITQGAARKLLTIARVDPKQVEKAAEQLSAGESAEDAITVAMSRSDNALTMWNSWQGGKPGAGSGLWSLEMTPEKFPMQHLPKLTASDVAKALDMEFTADSRKQIENYLNPMNSGGARQDISILLEKYPEDANLIERIAHLLNPPACSTCPFHAVADRSHYCGFKPCHQRKRKAWVADEMEKISRKLKIAVYDSGKDDKTVFPLQESTGEAYYKACMKLVADKDPALRIQAHRNEYSTHKWTESHFCRLVLVGLKAQEAKDTTKERRDNSSQAKEQAAREREWKLRQARREAVIKFTDNYAEALFATAFKGMDHIPAMCALARTGNPKKGIKKVELLADLRQRIAARALDGLNGYDYELFAKGPVATAKYLQKVATTWGVKLPADFLTVAKGFEPASTKLSTGVSTETKKAKK